MNNNDENNPQQEAVNHSEAEFKELQVEATSTEDLDVESALREIEAAEKRHERFAHTLVHLPDGKVQVTEERNLLFCVEASEKTIEQIVSSEGPAVRKVKDARARDGFRYEFTKIGVQALVMSRDLPDVIRHMFPDYGVDNRLTPMQEECVPKHMRPIFNPRITVALHASDHASRGLRWCIGIVPDANQPDVRSILSHMLKTIRRVCRSKRFKYLENNHRQNARLRFKGACEYMTELFEQYSKLLILRVDLYFRPNEKEWADTEAAGRSINSFMRALRDGRVVPDMAGWLYRIENGFRRGIHVHLLVAMDGHKHREAATWSQAIGEAWVAKYSAGHGSYFNCYTRKDHYTFNGLGLVHISDHEKLLGLREALRYVTKPDFHITTGFTKNFRKGQPPNSKEVTKRGAPRKAEHDMSLVNKVLRGN